MGGLFNVLFEGADLVLLNQDPDQIAAHIVALLEPVERLAGEKLSGDLTLEFDAVGAGFAIGFHPSKARLGESIHCCRFVRNQCPLQTGFSARR
jgi:hypothetical protein